MQLTLAGVDLESLSGGTIAQLKADIIASILEVEAHIAASDIVGVQLTTDSFGNTIATVIFSSRVPTERTNAIATRVAADAETGDFAPIVDGVAVTATDVVVAHTLATNNPTVEVTMPGVSLDEFSDEDKQSLHSALVLVLLADNSTRMDASDVVGITFTENEDGDMVAVLILSASTLLGRVEAAVAAIATEIEESSLINLVPGISDATGEVTVVSSTLVADVDDGGGEAVQFELAGISASSLDENDLAKLKADIINAIVGANAGMSRSELIGVEMRSGDDGELVATVRFGNSVDAATAVAAGNAFDHEVASGDVAISHIPGTRETDASAGGAIDVQVERKDGIIYEAIQFTFADSELGDLTANEEDDLRDSVIGQVYASAATISTADILGAEISTNNDGQTVAIVSFMNRQDGDTADILAKNLEELSESGRFDFPETKISQRPSTFETTNAIGEGTQTAFQFELDGNRLVSLSPTQQDDLKDSMLEAIFDSNPTLSRSQVIGVNLGTNAADGDTVVSVVLGSNVAANSPEAAISAAANALQAHLGLNTDLFADIFGEDGVSSSIAPVPPTVSVEHGTLDAFGFEAVTFTIDNVAPTDRSAYDAALKADVINAVTSTSSGVPASGIFGVDIADNGSSTSVTIVVVPREFGVLSTNVAEDVQVLLGQNTLTVKVDGQDYTPTSIVTASKGDGDETLVFTFPDVRARALDVSAEVQIEDDLIEVLVEVGANALKPDDIVGVDILDNGNGGLVVIVPLAPGMNAAAVADGFRFSTTELSGSTTLIIDGMSETPINIVAASSFGTERNGIQIVIPGLDPSAQSINALLSFKEQLIVAIEALGIVPDSGILGVEFKADDDNNLVAIVALESGLGASVAADLAAALQAAIEAGTLLVEKGGNSFPPQTAEVVNFDNAAASASMIPANYVYYDPFEFNLQSSMVYYISLNDLSGQAQRDRRRHRRFVPDSQLISEFLFEFEKLMFSMQILESKYVVGFLPGRGGFTTTVKGLNQFQREDFWGARCTMCIEVQRYTLCPVLSAKDQALFDAADSPAAADTDTDADADAEENAEAEGAASCETRLTEPVTDSNLDASTIDAATEGSISGGITAAIVVGIIVVIALVSGYIVLKKKKSHNGGNKVGPEKNDQFVPDKPDSPPPSVSPRKPSLLPGHNAAVPSEGKVLRKLSAVNALASRPGRRLSGLTGLGVLPSPEIGGALPPPAIGGALPPSFGGFGSIGGLGNTFGSLTPTTSKQGGAGKKSNNTGRSLGSLASLGPPRGSPGSLSSLKPSSPGGLLPPPAAAPSQRGFAGVPGAQGASTNQRRLELRPIAMPHKLPPPIQKSATAAATQESNHSPEKTAAQQKPLQIGAYTQKPGGLAKPKLGAVGGIPTKRISSSGLAKLASSPFGATPGLNKFLGGLADKR